MSAAIPSGDKPRAHFNRIGILFAGGPAPAANAVISTCAVSFLRAETEVVGIKNGYSHLLEFSESHPLQEGIDYMEIGHANLKRTRNTQGVMIGTSRANPGIQVSSPSHLDDPERSAPLKAVYDALCYLGVEALISIGGDDTLKSANKLKLFQERLPACRPRIPIVHVPKTIDNDYLGIDFTFGYFTAVETLASEIRNLLADAEASNTYFVVETMGRSAGWLAYGAAIAGEASLVLSVEDISGKFLEYEQVSDSDTGGTISRPIMNLPVLVERVVALIRLREEEERKYYGAVLFAEGLAEFLPAAMLEDTPRDAHGHIAVANLDLGRLFSKLIAAEYERQTGKPIRVRGLQLGYESRCARPQAFDVMLGSQLGVGAYRALTEEGLDGVMVSVSGQLDLHYVEFDKLIDPETLVTVIRFIDPESDFYKLVRFLESDVNH